MYIILRKSQPEHYMQNIKWIQEIILRQMPFYEMWSAVWWISGCGWTCCLHHSTTNLITGAHRREAWFFVPCWVKTFLPRGLVARMSNYCFICHNRECAYANGFVFLGCKHCLCILGNIVTGRGVFDLVISSLGRKTFLDECWRVESEMVLKASAVEGMSLCMKVSVIIGRSQLLYLIISCHM
jgi:hypothetical protein